MIICMVSIPAIFHDLVSAFQNWMPEILNYFAHPVTNAHTESLNNLIRVIDRVGRGYSFKALRAKVLFTEGTLQKKRGRPQFGRKDQSDFQPGSAKVMPYQLFNQPSWMPARAPQNQHEETVSTLNYGASRSTLVSVN